MASIRSQLNDARSRYGTISRGMAHLQSYSPQGKAAKKQLDEVRGLIKRLEGEYRTQTHNRLPVRTQAQKDAYLSAKKKASELIKAMAKAKSQGERMRLRAQLQSAKAHIKRIEHGSKTRNRVYL